MSEPAPSDGGAVDERLGDHAGRERRFPGDQRGVDEASSKS
ncbi:MULTISPECIES: hypothetical protein [unclassified Streptomyces]